MSFWDKANWCPHPTAARIDNPERSATQLCGECGGIVQGLDEQLLREQFQAMARQSGYPMPQIGVDMGSLSDERETE